MIMRLKMTAKIKKDIISKFKQFDLVAEVNDVLKVGIYDAFTDTFVGLKKYNKNLILSNFKVTEYKDAQDRRVAEFYCQVVDKVTQEKIRNFKLKVAI